MIHVDSVNSFKVCKFRMHQYVRFHRNADLTQETHQLQKLAVLRAIKLTRQRPYAVHCVRDPVLHESLHITLRNSWHIFRLTMVEWPGFLGHPVFSVQILSKIRYEVSKTGNVTDGDLYASLSFGSVLSASRCDQSTSHFRSTRAHAPFPTTRPIEFPVGHLTAASGYECNPTCGRQLPYRVNQPAFLT